MAKQCWGYYAIGAQRKNHPGLITLGGLFGSPTWARTRDLRINSPALYRLSYRGIFGVAGQRLARARLAAWIWLPDLGSNQGPTD